MCGYKFKTVLTNKLIICRKCYPVKGGTSKLQKEFSDFLSNNNIVFEEKNRELIKPFEVDFYIPKHNLAIEMNGNYWHSETSGEKNRKYHLNKTMGCQEKNVKLIHIFEDEWLLKKEIVKSRILNLLGKTPEKIYARKCEIVEIDDLTKYNFLEENHIQGGSVDKIRIVLKYEGKIASMMTFSKNRVALGQKNEEGSFELNRFCSKINTNVIGAGERLFQYFIKKYNPIKITTYADCRWSGIIPENTFYQKIGFMFIEKTKPSYFYLLKKDYLNRNHRFALAKHKILQKFGGDPSKTEWQLAQENGYDRILDLRDNEIRIYQ